MSSLPLLEMFVRPNKSVPGASMSAELSSAAVDEALTDADGIPHLDKDLTDKYLADLATLSLLNQ